MEVSVRRMSDPSLGKRRSSNPLVGLDGSAAQQLMIPLGEGELGLTITNNAHGKGVVVSALLDGSLAAAAGLNVGDVIVSVNGTLAADHFVAIEAMGVQLGDVIISVNHTLVDAHDQAIGLVDAAPDTVQLVLRAEAASYIPSLH